MKRDDGRGFKRAKLRVGVRDFAAAAGVCYETALRAERAGKFEYAVGGLRGICEWVAGRRGMVGADS